MSNTTRHTIHESHRRGNEPTNEPILHIKGTALQQKPKVLSVGYNFHYKIIFLFV